MRTKLWKILLISFFVITFIGFLCMETNAQLSSWPAAISDPYASIFSGFGVLPPIGGTFGVTSLGVAGSFLYPSYLYYDFFDFDDYYWYWPSYPYLYPYGLYSYEPWEWNLPYFGVTSAYFPIYTEPPWWASALAFL